MEHGRVAMQVRARRSRWLLVRGALSRRDYSVFAAVGLIVPIDYSIGADEIVADNSIKTIADLKGKQVAYPFSTCDNLREVYALKQVGMTEADIQGVDTTPEIVPPALAAGAIAGATYQPNVSLALKLGEGKRYKVLYTSKEAPGLITDVLYFKGDFIQSNPDEAFAIIARHLDGTPAEAKVQYAGAYNIPTAEMSHYFEQRDDAESLFKVGAMIGERLVGRQQVKATPSIPDTFDASFAAALAAH